MLGQKKELHAELNRLRLQIDSLNAQVRNTFSVTEKDEFNLSIKNCWNRVDNILDQLNGVTKNEELSSEKRSQTLCQNRINSGSF